MRSPKRAGEADERQDLLCKKEGYSDTMVFQGRKPKLGLLYLELNVATFASVKVGSFEPFGFDPFVQIFVRRRKV